VGQHLGFVLQLLTPSPFLPELILYLFQLVCCHPYLFLEGIVRLFNLLELPDLLQIPTNFILGLLNLFDFDVQVPSQHLPVAVDIHNCVLS
jgi:hypothetical protein